MERWMNGWMDRQTNGWVDRRKDGCMDEWMDGRCRIFLHSLFLRLLSLVLIFFNLPLWDSSKLLLLNLLHF